MMKKYICAASLLFLCGCQPAVYDNDISWKLAVVDTGSSESVITWYNADLEPVKTDTLVGKQIVSPWQGLHPYTGYDSDYAYLLAYKDQPKNEQECGVVRISLENGTISFLPTESFTNTGLVVTDTKIAVLQHTQDLEYYRSVLPKDGSENTITHDLRGGRLYWPYPGGVIACSVIPPIRLFRMNEQFEETAQREIISARDYAIGGKDVWRPVSQKAVFQNGKLYIPVERENHTYRKVGEVYEPEEFLGISGGLMELDPETLEYTVYSSEDYISDQILLLNDTEILLSGSALAVEQNAEKEASGSRSEQYPVLFDCVTKTYTEWRIEYVPKDFMLGKDALYVIDSQSVIHEIDPGTREEIRKAVHHTAVTNPYGSASCLLVNDPKETAQ